MALDESANEEYCPSCGSFVNVLDEETGWCPACTNPTAGHHHSIYDGICVRCSSKFRPDGLHIVCSACRREVWLATNANAIEAELQAGHSFAQAEQRVKLQNRATCLSCGGVIKGRNREQTYFCRENAPCRSAARRVRTLSESYSHDEALYLVCAELGIHKEYLQLRSEIGEEDALKQLRDRQ